MNDQTVLEKVRKPSIFWRSIHLWVKLAIIVVGLIIGAILFVPFWVAVGPYALLLLVGASVATVTKIVVIAFFVISVLIAFVVVPWITFLLIHWIYKIIFMAKNGSKPSDFIFKSK